MPRKPATIIPIEKTLAKVRPTWMERVGQELARGMDVRAGFDEQLERFFEVLVKSVTSGDPGWIDTILLDWAKASTETDLQEGLYQVTFILNRMIVLTIEVAKESLTKQQALDLLAAVIPIYTYGLGVVARYEMETRVAHISGEMEKVQKKMERVDKSKSAFISVAAHELKTPITLIDGYASMMDDLIKEGNGVPLDGLLTGMQSGINRLRTIVEDMLDVSMIDNKLLKLNFQPTQIEKILLTLKNDARETIASRRQTLEVVPFEGSRQWIYVDPARITQALRNVIHNAIKYTPDGGTISIDGRTLPGLIEVTIKDNGIGISLENQSVIFEKFGQVGRLNLHSSGKTKFKGAGPGLGLPISKGILEAHGGSIWVESEGYDEEECPGSIFHVLIPIRTEAPETTLAKLFNELEKKD
ncbi:MAG: HAMP domain-containing histidine kinase [Anaerolineales bacterium]|nr:HAMP domain-containing histidine kinase [Anaerolineales bacterium]